MNESKYGKKPGGNGVRLFLVWLAVLAVAVVPRITEEPAEKIGYELLEVIDGDTVSIMYEDEPMNVRLIGVDAPESVHPDENNNSEWGVVAGEHLQEMLAGTSCVWLEFDAEQYDAYDRLLAYVYFEEADAFEESLNYRMISEGYAINKEYKPNVKYAGKLQAACREARGLERGMWSEEGIEEIWK